jgi:HlyD family secretion protein
VLVVGVLLLVAWVYRARPVTVEVANVTHATLRQTVEETGRTKARHSWLVSAPVGGRLHRITLEPGDPVEAGRTVLAVLSPSAPGLLDERARIAAEARVKEATAALRKAEAGVVRARTAQGLAQEELSRARMLAASQAITRQDLDRRRAEAASAAAELEGARATVEMAGFEREAAVAQLAGGRGSAGREAAHVVYAPADGQVLSILIESEAHVAAGTKLLEIGTTQDLEVEVDVASGDAVRIKAGQRAILARWGGDTPLSGQVRWVSPMAFTKVSALGVEEQRVEVRIALGAPPDTWRGLGIGYAVDVSITVEEIARALVVPREALIRGVDSWSVFTLQGDKATRRLIEIRRQDAASAQVLRGLTEGERVILHPGARVAEGARVRIHEVTERAAH